MSSAINVLIQQQNLLANKTNIHLSPASGICIIWLTFVQACAPRYLFCDVYECHKERVADAANVNYHISLDISG